MTYYLVKNKIFTEETKAKKFQAQINYTIMHVASDLKWIEKMKAKNIREDAEIESLLIK